MVGFSMRTLQLALGAAVLSAAGLVSAQTGNAAAPAAAPAAPVAAPADAPKPAAGKKHHHKHHHGHKHAHRHHHDGKPASREAAAARAEAQKGRLADGKTMTEYERNAFARCQVFKTDIDRRACADRVKQGAASGSVQDGGILRESTIEVPVAR